MLHIIAFSRKLFTLTTLVSSFIMGPLAPRYHLLRVSSIGSGNARLLILVWKPKGPRCLSSSPLPPKGDMNLETNHLHVSLHCVWGSASNNKETKAKKPERKPGGQDWRACAFKWQNTIWGLLPCHYFVSFVKIPLFPQRVHLMPNPEKGNPKR